MDISAKTYTDVAVWVFVFFITFYLVIKLKNERKLTLEWYFVEITNQRAIAFALI